MKRSGALGARVVGAFAIWLCAHAAYGQTPCPAPVANLFVRNVMADIYLWNDTLPDVDPTQYPSPEAYLDAVRYRPLDSHYSYIDDRAANEAFFSDSAFVGFGFSSTLEWTAIRISQVFPDSPAAEAGLRRGDRILTIDGQSINDLILSGTIGSAFGPSTAGVARELSVLRDGRPFTARPIKRVVTIPTVSDTQVIQAGGRRIGYVFFRNFVQPSFEALDAAFAELQAQAVSELVLDLRYNGGGMVSVAEHLAGLIGGARTDGQLLGTYAHNAGNAFRNTDLRIRNPPQSLTLDRLVVIATGATASASELIVNGLRPFMPVVLVGGRTYGKPVGQYAVPFCDKILAPVAFSIRNAAGEGDYFDGMAPTCAAADDLDHQLGDPAEASLLEALAFIETGACSGVPTASPQRQRVHRPHSTGLDSLILAH